MMRATALSSLPRWLSLLASVMLLVWGATASAQEDEIPDSVAADVEGSKTKSAGQATFVKAPDAENLPAEEPEEKKAEVDWNLSAGGAFNTGNTQSWNLNLGTNVLVVKQDHRLSIDSLFNFGRARANVLDPNTTYDTVAKKWFFNSRYEYYFTEKDAIWAALGIRWDPLAGFDLQLLANAGYLRAFIKEEKQLFTGRIGYSYTYENYTAEALTSPDTTLLFPTSNIHGLLAALDYENHLNEHVDLTSTIVYIGNLNEIPAQDYAKAFQDNRIYFTIALLSQVADKLSIEARFLLLYDSRPAGVFKTDTTTLFSLVYSPFKSKEE
jgi:putative salt-induced outer membrane protein YdiY